jgi:DNA-binding IscR family transcriptional regulator
MTDANTGREAVDEFLLENIDSIPHLEALLLLWRRAPQVSSAEEMARALYVSNDFADRILRDLAHKELVITSSESAGYSYNSSGKHHALIPAVDAIYRKELIRVSQMIHSKAPSAMREFARAFRFTKEKD